MQSQDHQKLVIFFKNQILLLDLQLLKIQTYFGSENFTNVAQQRNFSFIANANFSSSSANIITEMPHNLSVGSLVEVINAKSSVNTTGAGNSGFNGTFRVTGISSAREFTVGMSTDPGTFTVIDTITRDYYTSTF